MVFTCAPLSRRAIQLFLLIFTLATFLALYHHWKGSGFKKGVCVCCSMPWEPPLWVSSAWPPLSEGSRLPSLVPSPLCSLNENPSLMLVPVGNHRWSVPSCYSDSNVSPPFGHLSWLSQDVPWIPPWHLWYHQGPHCPPLHPSQHSPLPDVPSVQQAF